MPHESVDMWLGFVMLLLTMMSVGTWFMLMSRLRNGPLLPYEPRRPVPWGAIGPVIVMLFIGWRIVAVVYLGETPPQPDDFENPGEMLKHIAGSVALQFVLFGSFVGIIAFLAGATLQDIGLPEHGDQFFRDARIGIVAWLAALVPVYGLQALFVTVADQPSSHPLIQVMLEDPSWPVVAIAFLAAVVVAPLSEELLFRLLLQGWLEKFEDESLGWRRVTQPIVHTTEIDGTLDEVVLVELNPTLAVEPPSQGLLGLPYGWVPIVISAAVFAAAHLGHGPDPIPLFVLALILGYLYQRTHRIAPCIVVHLLFNLTTLIMLAVAILTGSKLP